MAGGLTSSCRCRYILRANASAVSTRAIFKKPSLKTPSRKKREMPQGLWQKCPGCGEVVHEIELVENQRVCPRCDYHFTQSARERMAQLCDADSFVEMDAGLASIDT